MIVPVYDIVNCGPNNRFVANGKWVHNSDVNVQNLPRKSPLRAGICAPKGYKLIIVDLSNIELRLGLWLAGQDDKVDLLKNGVDLYKDLASVVFNKHYDDIAKDSMERTIGKVISLAGIYGTSGAKTKEIMRIQAKVNTPLEEAKAWIDLYRRQYYRVVQAWQEGDNVLQALSNGNTFNYLRDGIIRVENSMMIKPNGMVLTYPNLRKEVHNGKQEWRYDNRGGYVQGVGLPKFDKVYSSKVYQRCLGPDTEVMTNSGWKMIVDITTDDLLWDGEQWVDHDGLIYKGDEVVIDLMGVDITPDHIVYSKHEAVEASKVDLQECLNYGQRGYQLWEDQSKI